MRLDTILAVNGIKAQPMMHAVLLNGLPVELCHLAAASSSSPQPYDDLTSGHQRIDSRARPPARRGTVGSCCHRPLH
ncbi:hypothetical protein HPB52_010044 [Rhipicephalus sanguineus]|uniref:Uncharacterized protein n=1 Tax=Rhipicephalus sanguineus TaxID=34632 RepID=A0A9D4PVH5_RHISA|nr:hypothetical protein HPB52_010044 [Rhipicephalus sanguineus]